MKTNNINEMQSCFSYSLRSLDRKFHSYLYLDPHWMTPLPPPPMMPNGPQWRPTMNNNQPLFPIATVCRKRFIDRKMIFVLQDVTSSFAGRNFWPPGSNGQPTLPPPLPPLPPQPPQFSAAAYQHSPVDKRIMNTSFNTSIPSLMDLPSYKQNHPPPPQPPPPPPPLPIPPVPVLPGKMTV